jgi:hypothetical protein
LHSLDLASQGFRFFFFFFFFFFVFQRKHLGRVHALIMGFGARHVMGSRLGWSMFSSLIRRSELSGITRRRQNRGLWRWDWCSPFDILLEEKSWAYWYYQHYAHAPVNMSMLPTNGHVYIMTTSFIIVYI